MPMIAVPIAAWAAAAGAAVTSGFAAVTGVIGAALGGGALASAVAVGVVSGAVIGAATAAITGENILKGALKGAVIGGVTAGVFHGFSSLAKGAAGSASGAGTKTSVGMFNEASAGSASELASSTNLASDVMSGAEANLLYEAAPASYSPGAAGVGSTAIKTIPKSPTRGFFNKLLLDKEGALTDGAGKILSGGVEGIAKAALMKEPESQSEYLQKVQELNVSGDFQSRVANIKIPDFWRQYSQNTGQNTAQNQAQSTAIQPQVAQQAPALPPQPLLKKALTPQQLQQGVAYAQPI